ncbi:MAG: TonB-dependent receptor [Chitinophagales bacterium]
MKCKKSYKRFSNLRYILLLSLLISVSAWSQDIQILNKVTLEPVKDVLVYNASHNFWEVTDNDGKVTLIGLELLDTIYVQHQAYIMEVLQLEDLFKSNYKVFLTQKVVLIDEVVITAGKTEEVVSDVSNQVKIITKDEINFRNPQTTADLLAQSGEVFVQKSQMGGGSPVLRGFEANKVLLVIDGVRMNNAIYRNGHLQNSITIDPSSLERAEVVFGPGAVIYGSDAIGGVMHFVTKEPTLTLQEGVKRFKGDVYTRFSSANMEKTVHGALNMGFNKWGSFTDFTYSDFDDLKMGRHRSHGFKEWGISPYYVDRIDGRDTVLVNDKPHKQIYSGYSQWNVLQKFKIQANDNLKFGIKFQASSTSNIPRYEQLNDFEIIDSLPYPTKFSEWYYGPQKFILGAFNVDIKEKKAFDNGGFTFAVQALEETRVDRRFQKTKRNASIENVKVASVNGDFGKKISDKTTLQYGFEATYNNVQSNVLITDIVTNEETTVGDPTRYPDGGSNTQSYAFYLMDKWRPNEKVVIHAGIRYSHFILQSKFIDTSFIKLPITNFKLSRGAISGSVGLVFKPVDGFELKINGSSGFRAPNVDDYGKVREQAGEVTVPNLDLKPEYAYNAEIGLVKNFDKIARLSVTAYYTHLTDAIVRTHTTINGSDSILYQGDSVYIITNDNILNARVYGFAIGFYTDIGKYISMTANFNFTKGKEKPTNVPMSHIPPFYGRVSMLAKVKRFQAELWVQFNGQKTLANYGDSEDRADEAIPDLGTVGWFTLNLRTTAQLHKNLTLQLAIENIIDTHYKPFSSGISAPGRNFIVTLRGRI